MFGFWELLEKQELPNCLNWTRNELGATFEGVRCRLTTRKVPPSDPKGGTFIREKQGQKQHFLVVFAPFFKG